MQLRGAEMLFLFARGFRNFAGFAAAMLPAAAAAQTAPDFNDAAFDLFPYIPLVIGLVFMALGGVIFWISRRARQQARAAEAWPTVPATVTSAEISMRRKSTGTGRDRGRQTVYTPVVRYSYTVAGVAYQGDRVSFGPNESPFRGAAEKIVAKYPVGAPITVRHDPATPSRASIEATAKSALLPMIVGGIFVAIGAVLALGGIFAAFAAG